MSVPDGWPHNELERVLQDAATNPAARPRFGQLLLESEIYCVVPAPDPSQACLELPPGVDHRLTQPGESFSLMSTTMEGGRSGVFGFTSLETLRVWTAANQLSDAHFVAMKGRDLLNMVRDASLLVNVIGPYGKELMPTEIRQLLGGMSLPGEGGASMVTKETNCLVGAMAQPPHELLQRLKEVMKADRRVVRAWCLGLVLEGVDAKVHPAIVLELTPGADRSAVIPSLGAVVQVAALPADQPVDFFVLGQSHPISEAAHNHTPFYVRSFLGGLFGR